MKKLHEINKTDEDKFKQLVSGEAKKHSTSQKRNVTKQKSSEDYLKNIAKKLVFECFKNSKNVLCIGCRHEAELFLFEKHGLNVEGIDPAIQTNKIKQAPAEKMLEFFKEDQFDFIYASHSLEHVVIPEKVMGNIRKVAKSGCYIILPVIIRDTPKIGHPTLYDICKQSQNSTKEALLISIKEDFKMFEPYNVEDIFYIDGHEPEFHICLKW